MLSKDKILSLITNNSLELILFPTEQCNFRCVYCYEDFSIGKMQKKTLDAIKKLIALRINELDSLKISWFGGEPLAAKDIVYDLSETILQLRKLHPKLNYQASMTTNGYRLNAETLSKLISLGVTHYQISLDGTESNHNKTRLRLDGAGTFQAIWNNLLAAKASDHHFSIILRLHITPENLLDMYHLLDQIKQTFRYDRRFSVFFKPIEDLGGPKAGTFKVLRGKDKSEIIQGLYAYLGQEMKPTKLDEQGPYVCYAAMTNSLVIRADGKIGKCTVALKDDRNIVGHLNEDGTLDIAPNKLALWTRGIRSQNLTELSCPLYQLPPLIVEP